MEDEDDNAPRRPNTPFGPEQGAWSSPARGIALGLALSAVLWLAIALVVRVLWEWWQSGALGSRSFEPPRVTDS